MSERDNYKPTGKWAFDEGVTKVFDDMISRSIPGYQTMRDSVVRVAAPILCSANVSNFLEPW